MRSIRFRSVAAAALVSLLLAGCSESTPGTDASLPQPDGPATDGTIGDGGPVDGGGGEGGDGPPHNLDELEVEGTVALGYGSPATGVDVTGRCGAKEVSTKTDNEGHYRFVADVKDCSPLVIEYNKESYLPNYRVLHLPPPTSPVTVDVPLAELGKLQCGTYYCINENVFGWTVPPEPMKQGWAMTMAGASALDYYGGEFRQDDGRLLALVGFAYYDFRDQGGAKIETFKDPKHVFAGCVPVPTEALDWLGDVDLKTDIAEMRWYSLDPTTGRWSPRPDLAVISATKGNLYDMKDGFCVERTYGDGNPIKNIHPIKRDELDDVRARQLTYKSECFDGVQKTDEIWVCGNVYGSGWYAWGIDLPKRNCFTLEAKDQCDNPLPNVVFSVKGRDHGYRAEVWTDYAGKACIDVVPSEPVGSDYDADTLGGETFWVDLEMVWNAGQLDHIESHKIGKPDPTKDASCADPTTCVPLEQVFSDHTQTCL